MSIFRLSSAVLGAAALAGCAAPQAPAPVAISLVDQQIVAAAQRIQRAQSDLYVSGALDSDTKPGQLEPSSGDAVTLSWQGDAVQLLAKLARDNGSTFSYVGTRLPLPISVNVENAPLSAVFAMVQSQIGYRARLVTNPGAITLEFHRPQQTGGQS